MKFFVVDEELTLEALKVIQDSTLATVVPKAGPRALLMSKIEEV
jgi:hypothetical protein